MKSQSPNLFIAALEQHPLVERYRDAGRGDHRLRVTLTKGHAFGQDGPHWTVGTAEAALEHLRWVDPCACGRCVS